MWKIERKAFTERVQLGLKTPTVTKEDGLKIENEM